MFEENQSESFPEREKRILRFWKENAIFSKSLHQRATSAHFSFYDGPPFATGLPHYGHLLAGTIKDVVPRYKTMKGYYVQRRFGWDCHGLPIENEIEKTFQLSGSASIEAFGIHRFNEECRKIVLRYTEEWKSTVERMGRWVDFSMTWKTMDLSFMESVWWVFKELWNKDLVYQGYKVMPFSAKLGTPLSNFEASENYKDVDDPSLVVALPLKEINASLLVWTTTPWTLISNMAATVGASIEYALILHSSGNRYILAKESLSRWLKSEENYRIEKIFSGSDLVGYHYEPPFDYYKHLAEEGAFQVISDDFVTLEEGTGIVHIAPAFGETDFHAAKREGIPLVCPVNNNGQFTTEIPEYVGKFVKDCDKSIAKRLKDAGRIFYQGTIRHRYPFCWRSDTPLIYKAISTWFVKVEAIKEKILAANDQIQWTPGHLKEGRFGKWLEGARDWNISRNRYWGTPIPIWVNEEGDTVVVGSICELEGLSGEKVTDLHREYIDQIVFKKNGKIYKRIPEVFDCWFDAGSMPFGQNHYPFENQDFTEKTFPADFVAEGIDQTRGWFYTLTVIAAALFEKPAFKHVIVNGILLAEDGNKMSKRLRNYPEPELILDKYGADAVRLYMLHSPAVKADDLRFSEKGVELILRQILIPFWNAHSFFTTYARINHWEPIQHLFSKKPSAIIDRWILSQLNRLIHEVEEGMDNYDLSRAVEPFVGFIDQLTNWYIRRNRRRFWSDQDTQDRREAFETLYKVLVKLSQIAAPFVPFISEAIFGNLRSPHMPESVHLCDFPKYEEIMRDLPLEEEMDSLMLVVSLGHALRKEHKLKVRQPLSAIHIVCSDPIKLHFFKDQEQLIADELNVKSVVLHAEKREFVKFSIKPNFRSLGKKVGKLMREVQLLILQLDQEQINCLYEGGSILLLIGEEKLNLTSEDVEISHQVQDGWIAMHAGMITIALDTELNEELILEGIARELINKINTMRRQAEYSVTDRIKVHLSTSPLVHKALHSHKQLIMDEVLAVEMVYNFAPHSQQWDINGEPTAIGIERIDSSK